MADNKQPATPVSESKPRRALLFLRGILFFLAAVLLLGGLWCFCLHHHKNIAVWSGEDTLTDALVYDERTFLPAAPIGAYGMTETRFPLGELLGEVKPVSELPFGHAFEVYAVKDKNHFLRVSMEDGTSWVFYDEATDNPYHGEPETEEDDFSDLDWEDED